MVDNDDIETRLWDHYLASCYGEGEEVLEIETAIGASEDIQPADTN